MVDRTLRPIVPTDIRRARASSAAGVRANAALSKDGTDGMTAPLKHKSFAAAELVGTYAASLWEGSTVYDSDRMLRPSR